MTDTPPTRMRAGDLLTALLVVVLWGLNFLAIKWGLRSFTPFQLGAVRYVFAVLPLVFLLRPPRVHCKWVVLFGLFQGVGQFGFLFVAVQVGMTAGLASVLLQTQVFFTALLGFAVLGERPTRPLWGGLLLAALGLVCFVMNYVLPNAVAPGSVSPVAATTLTGLLLTLCAASMWAVSNIVSRRVQQNSPGFDPLAFVVWSSLVPIVPFIALWFWWDPQAVQWLQWERWAQVTWLGWGAAAYLGWVATLIGYGLWTRLLQRHPANRVAPFSLGVPVVGLTAGMWVLGELVTPWQWAGIGCLVAALLCVVFGPRLRAFAPRA